MNSHEGIRGFITFLILMAILGTGIAGFNYISIPTNTSSEADTTKTEPVNMTVDNISDTTANITWTTVDPATTNLIYSINMKAECLSNIESETPDCQKSVLNNSQTSHKALLLGLEPSTTYFFRIVSNGKIYPADMNHSFRTKEKTAEIPEPATEQAPISPKEDEFEGFGEVNTSEPQINKVLGVSDENISEPVDPLGDVDKLMQEEFKEAMIYNDIRYDFTGDGEVTAADWPGFINFATNPED